MQGRCRLLVCWNLMWKAHLVCQGASLPFHPFSQFHHGDFFCFTFSWINTPFHMIYLRFGWWLTLLTWEHHCVHGQNTLGFPLIFAFMQFWPRPLDFIHSNQCVYVCVHALIVVFFCMTPAPCRCWNVKSDVIQDTWECRAKTTDCRAKTSKTWGLTQKFGSKTVDKKSKPTDVICDFSHRMLYLKWIWARSSVCVENVRKVPENGQKHGLRWRISRG